MQNVRLLATVLAKNAVGSSWRKTLGTREWSRIPESEKEHVRSAAAGLLLKEPQRRVATQTGLLIANIARFDFPAKWPTLLADLTSAAWWLESGVTPEAVEQNDRALFTLKHVVRAVKSKRIVVETTGPSGGSVSTAGLSFLFTGSEVLLLYNSICMFCSLHIPCICITVSCTLHMCSLVCMNVWYVVIHICMVHVWYGTCMVRKYVRTCIHVRTCMVRVRCGMVHVWYVVIWDVVLVFTPY